MPPKEIKILRLTIPHLKHTGFSLFELIVIIILISILALITLDRVWTLRIEAEQADVSQVVGNLKSALGLEVSRLALAGNISAIIKLDNTNPVLLLSQAPNNYIGEFNHITKSGVWYFDIKQKILIYNVVNTDHFKTTLIGMPRIRYRIKLVYIDRNNNKHFDLHDDSIAGLDLFLIDKFSWNVNSNINKT